MRSTAQSRSAPKPFAPSEAKRKPDAQLTEDELRDEIARGRRRVEAAQRRIEELTKRRAQMVGPSLDELDEAIARADSAHADVEAAVDRVKAAQSDEEEAKRHVATARRNVDAAKLLMSDAERKEIAAQNAANAVRDSLLRAGGRMRLGEYKVQYGDNNLTDIGQKLVRGYFTLDEAQTAVDTAWRRTQSGATRARLRIETRYVVNPYATYTPEQLRQHGMTSVDDYIMYFDVTRQRVVSEVVVHGGARPRVPPSDAEARLFYLVIKA